MYLFIVLHLSHSNFILPLLNCICHIPFVILPLPYCICHTSFDTFNFIFHTTFAKLRVSDCRYYVTLVKLIFLHCICCIAFSNCIFQTSFFILYSSYYHHAFVTQHFSFFIIHLSFCSFHNAFITMN